MLVLDLAAVDAAVDAGAEHAFAFLERLVAASSTLGQEAAALAAFDEEITSIGFSTRRVPIPADIGDDPRSGVPPEFGRAPAPDRYSVVGRLGPSGSSPSLLLNGHIDVVPAATANRWSTPPFQPRREAGRLFGRGAGDMKCGFAMGVLAIRALLAVDPDVIAGRLDFLAVVEEECTGNGTLAAALEGVLADAVILLEPTDLGLLVGGVGVLWVDVDVVGFSTHAQMAHLSINPFDLVTRLVAGLRDWAGQLTTRFPDAELAAAESPYNVNVGAISGGDWPSSVPTEVTVRLRLGFPRAWTPADAEREVRDTVAKIVTDDGGFPVEPTVRFTGFRAPGYLLDHAHPLTRAMADAHVSAHDAAPRTFSLGSTTDARIYVKYFDVPALCYGPSAENIHGVDESVELASIVAGAKTLARFIATWFAPGPGPAADGGPGGQP